jgi:AcrR family transcriptional regulator
MFTDHGYAMLSVNGMSTERRKYEQKVRAERRQETRRRIVEATVRLHGDVGPARTTVAEIARRAGVSRLTVYQHFPSDADLYGACQSRFIELNPRPDLGPAMALADPEARVGEALRLIYRGYRQTEPMTAKIQRDRHLLPALNDLMENTADQELDRTADILAAGFRATGKREEQLRALARLALDFWTWRRLSTDGLDDAEAGELMTGAIRLLGEGRIKPTEVASFPDDL